MCWHEHGQHRQLKHAHLLGRKFSCLLAPMPIKDGEQRTLHLSAVAINIGAECYVSLPHMEILAFQLEAAEFRLCQQWQQLHCHQVLQEP